MGFTNLLMYNNAAFLQVPNCVRLPRQSNTKMHQNGRGERGSKQQPNLGHSDRSPSPCRVPSSNITTLSDIPPTTFRKILLTDRNTKRNISSPRSSCSWNIMRNYRLTGSPSLRRVPAYTVPNPPLPMTEPS